VSAGVSYSLTVLNPEGVAATATLTVPAIAAAPPRSGFALRNQRQIAVNAFLLNADDLGGVFIGRFEPGDGSAVSLPQCRVRSVQSLDPARVLKHNKDFPTGTQFDPDAVITARTGGGLWLLNNSGYRLGFGSASVEPMYL
jgi:hypothetical protein